MMLAAFAGHAGNYVYHSLSGRFLSIGEYGLLTAILGLLQITSLPLQSFSLAVTAAVSRDPGSAEPLLRQWSLRFVRAFPILLMISLFLARVRGYSLSMGAFLAALIFASLLLALTGAALQGLQRFAWLSLRAIGLFPGRAVLLAGFLFMGSRSAGAALSAHGIAVFMVLFLSLLGLHPLPSPTGTGEPGILRFTLQSFPALLGFSILMTADVVLARMLWEPEAVGVFAKAAVPARMLLWLPLPIASVLFPKLADPKAPHPRRTLRKALLYSALLILPAWGMCVFFPGILLRVLYGPPVPGEHPGLWLRSLATALAPLPVIHLLLQAELTGKRPFLRILLPVGAAVYVGSVLWLRLPPDALIRLITLLSWGTAVLSLAVLSLPHCNPRSVD